MVDLSKLKIERHEILYIIISSLFAVLWFAGLLQLVVGAWGNNYAVLQFLLFDIGIYLFLFIFLKALITDMRFNLKTSLGLTFLMMAFDIYMPEYHVSFSGQLIPGGIMGVGSSDYIIGLLGKTIGLPGIALFLFTYLLFPAIFFLIAAKLLPNFVKKL